MGRWIPHRDVKANQAKAKLSLRSTSMHASAAAIAGVSSNFTPLERALTRVIRAFLLS